MPSLGVGRLILGVGLIRGVLAKCSGGPIFSGPRLWLKKPDIVKLGIPLTQVAPRYSVPGRVRIILGRTPAHLDYYLDEFTFRFNRRRSRHRGKLFFRLAAQAVQVEPVPYHALVKHVRRRTLRRHKI